MNPRCRSSTNLRGEAQWVRSSSMDDASDLKGVEQLDEDAVLDTLINQIEFVRILSAAKDLDDFCQRILAVLEPLGFSDFAVARRMQCGTIEVPLCSLPSEFVEAYRDEQYCKYDMALDYVDAGSLDPIYLSMIRRVVESASLTTLTFKKNHDLLLLYQKFDVQDAYLMPVKYDREEEEERAVVSFMVKGCGFDEFMPLVNRSKPILQLLADAVNFIGHTKFYAKEPRQIINLQPLKLLTMMALNDLSLNEAAKALRISLDTANKHMALAKKALGTTSQANAVYLAVKQGIIPL